VSALALFAGLFLWVGIRDPPLTDPVIWAAATFCLLGSLMPDFDKKGTAIRYAIGPVTGLVITLFIVWKDGWTLDPVQVVSVFVAVQVMFLVFGLIRYRHRGAFHTIRASLVYGTVASMGMGIGMSWGVGDMAVLFVFSVAGYLMHLSLDRNVRW